uniref:Ig-like domain-containing protein n=1 Tax=Labrus bergylta TaxID=56723 RepID=A0A3Q3GI02_9LABR
LRSLPFPSTRLITRHDDLKIAFEVTEMPPRFINPICDMETPEGTTIMFECSLMGIPSPIVSWFKGDKKIPHNNKKYSHTSDGDNHFLKIYKVTPQDSGAYTCRAINIVGETLCRASLGVRAYNFINVLIRPKHYLTPLFVISVLNVILYIFV